MKNKLFFTIFIIVIVLIILSLKKLDTTIYINNKTNSAIYLIGLKLNNQQLFDNKQLLDANHTTNIKNNKLFFEETISIVFSKNNKLYEFLVDEYYLNNGVTIDIIETTDTIDIKIFNN